MSHLVSIETKVRVRAAIHAACRRLGLPAPTEGTFKFYSDHASGLGVRLPGWRYPAVCDTRTGQIHTDTYGGRWVTNSSWTVSCNAMRLKLSCSRPGKVGKRSPRKSWTMGPSS